MITYQDILKAIEAYDTIIIHRHQKPDPDAIGSQVGLAELLRHHFPNKRVLTTGFNEPTLTFLATMNDVADEDYQGSLVIVVDTANTARIDDGRYNLGDKLIKIDHHPNDDPYGDAYLVNTAASSCSEMIAEMALELGLVIPSTAARLLYAGIIGDTGRFLYPNTTAKTLTIASQLRASDFDAALITGQLDSFSPAHAKLMGYILEHLVVDNGGAALIVLSSHILQGFGLRPEEVSLVVGLPGKISTVNRWMICTEQADGRYRVNLRSKKLVINQLAKRYDGGGHPLASGAWAHSIDEINTIYQDLQNLPLTTD